MYEEIICVKSSNNFNFAITCHPLSVFNFFNYPSLPHFKSHWAQICDTYIPEFPWSERPFKIRIVQIRLILILKKSYRSRLLRNNLFKLYQTEKSVLTNFDWYVSTFCVKFWSLKMKTRRAITLLLDTVNLTGFLISMVTELYLK